MNNEIIKQKYQRLEYDIKKIKMQLKEINIDYEELLSLMRDNMSIDNKIIEEERLIEVKETQTNIYNEIEMILIPQINSNQ
ncbi:MAG TPA: hypothetical protein IAB35_03800 [Candidatus Faecimonas gallistercoris]|nr:hypothetical protein [Candidatus Faecimonas gallistercoris]